MFQERIWFLGSTNVPQVDSAPGVLDRSPSGGSLGRNTSASNLTEHGGNGDSSAQLSKVPLIC